jgi:O-antigen/teichoic acid export membrane protein
MMVEKLKNLVLKTKSEGLLGAGALLFVSMTIVNGGNYAFNLILGRWLGPADFSDLSLIVTIVLMSGFITAAFQLTSAKFAAVYSTDNDEGRMAAARRWLRLGALLCGGVILLIFAGGASYWQQFFHTQSAFIFIILGVALPIYLIQGVDRGALQGQLKFKRLAGSYQAEMWTRLIASVILVGLGYAVDGAVFAIGLSFAATWFVARQVGSWAGKKGELSPKEKRLVAAFAGPVVLAYAGQILISNSDIIIVKRYFSPELAGQYAALALIGRIVFFATWSIVTALFPIAAKKHQKGENPRPLLLTGVGIVAVISIGIIIITWFLPENIIGVLFGSAYLSMAPLLWMYAVATALFAIANVIVNYHLSIGRSFGTWLAIGFGLIQVVLLVLFHNSLQQVILVQIALMAALLLSLTSWDFWLNRRPKVVLVPAEVRSGA